MVRIVFGANFSVFSTKSSATAEIARVDGITPFKVIHFGTNFGTN